MFHPEIQRAEVNSSGWVFSYYEIGLDPQGLVRSTLWLRENESSWRDAHFTAVETCIKLKKRGFINSPSKNFKKQTFFYRRRKKVDQSVVE